MNKMDLYLYNSLTRKKEKFIPLKKGKVGMYTCGPTVYDYASIGNFRTYTTGDLLYRSLVFFGYQVDYVMNFTDVGHLTGDNLGDADLGKDRIEESARKQGKTAWDIAEFYIQAFLTDFKKLNLSPPRIFAKATDHIKEQIDLVKKLEEKGFTYRIPDGIYFDTQAYGEKTGSVYGKLSTLDMIKKGTRIEANPQKKNPRDFALWKFSLKPGERQMEWDSPWGLGFPGWHIECSAMSMKYLGESFDIHVGGEDLRSTHHPNEIAQAEGATGKKFVNYWIHGTFLKVDGKRMGKSLGNVYQVRDIEEKGFDPLALRYLYLTAHYRDPLNFTWESLGSAQTALNKLRTMISAKKNGQAGDLRKKFKEALANDLNTPQALAVLWEAARVNIELALEFDQVLGLNLAKIPITKHQIPNEIKILISKRKKLREEGKFEEADKIRSKIYDLGFKIKDNPVHAKI